MWQSFVELVLDCIEIYEKAKNFQEGAGKFSRGKMRVMKYTYYISYDVNLQDNL